MYPWRTPIDRTITLITESIFTCNTNYLARAYRNQTYNYEFPVPPALHGSDIYSTFYQKGQSSNLSQALYAPVANTLQTYIVNFAMTGNPNLASLDLMQNVSSGIDSFLVEGSNAQEMRLNYTKMATDVLPDIGMTSDPTANARCEWWQKGLYL